MLTESGKVKIIDLGLAKLSGGMAQDSTAGVTVGTVEYLSPEQARALPDVDIRSDIYSLGVSLFHMVVGEVPFKGEDQMEVIAKQHLQRVHPRRQRYFRRCAAIAEVYVVRICRNWEPHVRKIGVDQEVMMPRMRLANTRLDDVHTVNTEFYPDGIAKRLTIRGRYEKYAGAIG